MANDRFKACLDEVLRHEGGYADHPADPGGATNLGITRKTLAQWRGVVPWWALPKSAVKALERDEAAQIYRSRYWDRVRGDQLAAGLDLAVFDFAVNSGPDRAIRLLQTELGVVADGQIGPLTLAALDRRSATELIDTLCERRIAFLKRLPAFPTFGKGWSRRVTTIRQVSLRVAGAAATISNQPTIGRTVMDLFNGYKTYLVALIMLLAGLAQVLGIDLPALDGGSAGHLIMEALAVLFLRKGLKGDIART